MSLTPRQESSQTAQELQLGRERRELEEAEGDAEGSESASPQFHHGAFANAARIRWGRGLTTHRPTSLLRGKH